MRLYRTATDRRRRPTVQCRLRLARGSTCPHLQRCITINLQRQQRGCLPSTGPTRPASSIGRIYEARQCEYGLDFGARCLGRLRQIIRYLSTMNGTLPTGGTPSTLSHLGWSKRNQQGWAGTFPRAWYGNGWISNSTH